MNVRYQNDEPAQIPFEGEPIHCSVCRGDRFWITGARLATRLGSLLRLGFKDPKADVYVCARCGHLLWFMPRGFF